MRETGNKIVDLSFAFALEIISFVQELEKNHKYAIANQIIRSGTSIGANVHEAQNCESRADFIHKLKIAAKEADETKYWLLLCKHSNNYPYKESLLEQLLQVQKLLS
ncbi:MAG: four helix bundle protein, partial [Bacteroidales bacterium]|nr:four helix bundle protein [Bacteroidales bacterium]